MSLTRKFLADCGCSEEAIEKIIGEHIKTVNSIRDELDEAKKYKASADKLPAVQKELDELKKATEGTDGKNPWKVKYEAVKEDFDAFKKDIESKQTKEAKEKVFRTLLKEAGVQEKRIDSVVKVSDIDAIELDEKGNAKNASDLKKTIVNEWSDFIVSVDEAGANTSNPPAGGKTYKTKEDIMKIKDTTERQQAMIENHELFGF